MIRIRQFRGSRPRRSAKLLEDGQAQIARNARLTGLDLRPMRAPLSSAVLPHPGALKTIYLFARQFWFAWTADVDVARGTIPTDTTEKTYYTGDGFPKVTNSEIATAGGGTSYPNNWWRLGVPAPANAPIVVVDPDFVGSIEPNANEFQVWTYTYVTGWGEEGPPSPPSVVFSRDRDTNGALLPVDITLDAAPTGPYNVVVKRLYRLNTGNAGEDYQLVAEIPVAQTAYTDTTENENLSSVLLITTEWDMPPEGLAGLISLPNGVMAGFEGLDLYLTPPNQPHAWPRSYALTVDYPIVGLGSFGTTIVACTEGRTYLATGVDPEGMALAELELEQACVSKRSIARMGVEGVVYASPDGLVMVGPGGASVISEEWFTREEWQAFDPSSIVAYSHDRAYVAFYDNGTTAGAFIIDPNVDGIVHVDGGAVSGHVDLLTDTLYILIGSTVFEWDAGAPMTAVWRSGIYATRPINMGMAQVVTREALADPIELKVYADGVLRHTQSVTNSEPFRLPGGFLARDWSVEVSTDVAVDEILVGSIEDML